MGYDRRKTDWANNRTCFVWAMLLSQVGIIILVVVMLLDMFLSA